MPIHDSETIDERDERLALVMRATNDGIWDWDFKTNQVYFSARWKAMLGYADDEIGNTFDDWRRLVHPDDAEPALTLIQDNLQGKTSSYELEHRLQHKDGSYRWVLARGIALRDAQGVPYRMVGSHTDITDRKQIEETLQARLKFERLITSISTEFINLAPDEIDGGIQRALQAIGEFARVDRSYVFLISSDGATMDNTHEWCAMGIESFIAKLKAVPIETFPWLMKQLKRLEVVYVPSLDALPPEARAEKKEFEMEKIQSLIVVPMLYSGMLVGFLGFDSVLTEKTWSEDTIALLRIVGEIFANALEHKREQALQAGQRQFLELLATGGDFSEMLHTLIRIVEEQWRGMLGLILLLDEDGKHLHIGASVSLPQDYVDSIEGLEIGPMVGSCGTACYRRERMIVEDILIDPRWDGLRSLAVQYGFRACWSEPVIAKNGKVVGTFAMYYRQPRAPTQDELHTIATAAHLVGIAVEHQQAQEALHQSEARFRSMFEEAPVGMVITDGQTHRVNRAAQEIIGYTEEELSHMRPREYIHPDDVGLDERLHTESEAGQRDRYQIEKRYLPPDGRTVWARYTHTILRDDQKQPLLHFAVLEDITERRTAEVELRQAYESLERRVQERTRELAALNSIAATVSQSLNLDEIMCDALDQTMQVCGMDAGVAYELEDASQSLVLVAAKGLSEEFTQKMGARVPLPVALPGQTLSADRILEWQVARDYPEGEAKKEILREGFRSLFTVPLVAKGKMVGAFGLSSQKPRTLTTEESALLSATGQQIGIAIENARLYKQAQQLATTAERSRLARELHDSVTQSLYSMMLYAEAAARSLADKEIAEAGDFLNELRDTAQDALREMRLLIFELRPLALEKNGLIAALRTRLNAVEGRGGMKTELQANDAGFVEQLPFSMQEELYHIVQEALNNVIRHAHAQSVRLCIEYSEKTIHLQVVDDGIGFDAENTSENSGLGLRGMRERVQRIGGVVQIVSMPGKGTQVVVRVPMRGEK